MLEMIEISVTLLALGLLLVEYQIIRIRADMRRMNGRLDDLEKPVRESRPQTRTMWGDD